MSLARLTESWLNNMRGVDLPPPMTSQLCLARAFAHHHDKGIGYTSLLFLPYISVGCHQIQSSLLFCEY